jgi:hypothetical protein
MEYSIDFKEIDISFGAKLDRYRPECIPKLRERVAGQRVLDAHYYYKKLFEITDLEKMGIPCYKQVTISFDTNYVNVEDCSTLNNGLQQKIALMNEIRRITCISEIFLKAHYLSDYHEKVYEFYHMPKTTLDKIIGAINNSEGDIRNHVRIYLTKKIIVDTLYPVETCDEMQVDSICVEEPDEEITQINKKQKLV